MNPVIIIAIAFVLLIPLGISNTSYADLDVETIGLEVKGFKRIESDNSDVLILKMFFINNGKFEAYITTNYVYFVDSQERLFAPAYYDDLQKKGFPITEKDCPLNYGPTLNPGLSTEEINCYEVPKGIGNSFSLVHYSTLIGLCQQGFDCTIKSFPFTIKQHSEPTSNIPSWVKNIFVWYGQDKVSENELLNAIKFLIDKGILVVE